MPQPRRVHARRVGASAFSERAALSQLARRAAVRRAGVGSTACAGGRTPPRWRALRATAPGHLRRPSSPPQPLTARQEIRRRSSRRRRGREQHATRGPTRQHLPAGRTAAAAPVARVHRDHSLAVTHPGRHCLQHRCARRRCGTHRGFSTLPPANTRLRLATGPDLEARIGLVGARAQRAPRHQFAIAWRVLTPPPRQREARPPRVQVAPSARRSSPLKMSASPLRFPRRAASAPLAPKRGRIRAVIGARVVDRALIRGHEHEVPGGGRKRNAATSIEDARPVFVARGRCLAPHVSKSSGSCTPVLRAVPQPPASVARSPASLDVVCRWPSPRARKRSSILPMPRVPAAPAKLEQGRRRRSTDRPGARRPRVGPLRPRTAARITLDFVLAVPLRARWRIPILLLSGVRLRGRRSGRAVGGRVDDRLPLATARRRAPEAPGALRARCRACRDRCHARRC